MPSFWFLVLGSSCVSVIPVSPVKVWLVFCVCFLSHVCVSLHVSSPSPVLMFSSLCFIPCPPCLSCAPCMSSPACLVSPPLCLLSLLVQRSVLSLVPNPCVLVCVSVCFLFYFTVPLCLFIPAVSPCVSTSLDTLISIYCVSILVFAVRSSAILLCISMFLCVPGL